LVLPPDEQAAVRSAPGRDQRNRGYTQFRPKDKADGQGKPLLAPYHLAISRRFIEEAAVFNERMELRFDPGGTVTIVAGTHSHGQGHATTYAQMVSDWLGVPFEQVRHVQGDTDAVPFGRGTYAARSAVLGGSALRLAADAIIEKAKPMAAHLMEAAVADLEFTGGSFKIVGTDRAMALTDVAKAFFRPMMLPQQFSVGLDTAGSFSARFHDLVGETPTHYRDRWAQTGAPHIPGCYLFMRGLHDVGTQTPAR